jgi:ATP-dependent DNA helicase RecG
MVPPRFHDQGISFTVAVPNHALLATDDLQWLAELPAAALLSDIQRHALVAMRHGRTWTNQSFRETFPMDSREARHELAGLVDAGVAVAEGERRGRAYRLADHVIAGVARGPGNASRSEAPASLRPLRSAINAGPTVVGTPNPVRIADELRTGAKTVPELVANTGLTSRQVRYALQRMRDDGVVILIGTRGRTDSRYELLD